MDVFVVWFISHFFFFRRRFILNFCMLIHGRILILMSALNGVVREKPPCANELEVLVICFNLNRLTFLHVRVKASLPWRSGELSCVRAHDTRRPSELHHAYFIRIRANARFTFLHNSLKAILPGIHESNCKQEKMCVDRRHSTSFSSQHYLFSIRNDNDYLRPGDWLYYVTGDIKSSMRNYII